MDKSKKRRKRLCVTINEVQVLREIRRLKERGQKLGLSDDEIYHLFRPSSTFLVFKKLLPKAGLVYFHTKLFHLYRHRFKFIIAVTLVVLVVVTLALDLQSSAINYIYNDKCLISKSLLREWTGPYFSCDQCQNLTHVSALSQVSGDEAVLGSGYGAVPYVQAVLGSGYGAVPVLLKGACRDWGAVNTFSFQFFKELYTSNPEILAEQSNCQFFYYGTDFRSLEDVFAMSEDRAAGREGEERWYVGWSNCDVTLANTLRSHLGSMQFLPKGAENEYLLWIFMGSPGQGAALHIDYVGRPSWQAQLSGTKNWTLIPSPGCSHACRPLTVIVEPGDIFILDTNLWYHSTFIQPGDISITIGSEFD
ncbi:uncharacterized protein LOC131938739 [Physella acuta]|uniref:uncharacterized protein LOC131938739 n=1 Tax=Physella acuta TaxID=109671 RepID=UPI0027DADA4A|nr:uncharacterized protein LOC131938739 [Physella acuta]